MTQHLHRGISRLKLQVRALGELVEYNLGQAIEAFIDGDVAAARKAISSDREVDLMEVEVEEECLKLLALHQPVAADLRLIVSVLKINSDLERIGDFAVNIGWRVLELSDSGNLAPHGESNCESSTAHFDLSVMAERARRMLHQSLNSLVDLNCSLSREVLQMDDLVDAENRRIHKQAFEQMHAHPHLIERYTAILSVSRALERVADHATNIAEDVIYMVDGDIVRHGKALQV